MLSDVAYVQKLHGPLRRLVIRAFVASFRRTFGMLRKHFVILNSADFVSFPCSCSDCFGERGAGRWDIVQAEENHSVKENMLALES